MATTPCLIALDQGTTSSRAIAFAPTGEILAQAQRELPQHYPRSGWVEHDAERIWADSLAVLQETVRAARATGAVPAALGLTNQRETVVVWERANGRPIHRAIVWQDRRTAETTRALRDAGREDLVAARTGLLLDPYFSASKIAWVLDRVPGARDRARAGELAAGTIDSFLIWQLTGGLHATDITNASRTSLFDIHRRAWDEELCALFDVPVSLLPEVRPNAGAFGHTRPDQTGLDLAITGSAGDQQAAAIGQACLAPGTVKSTYGTGCFLLQNTGARPQVSAHKLLTTIAFQVGDRVDYALEGSIFAAGAAIQWLRDGLRVIGSAGESAALAAQLPDNQGVYLVPAFTGLGAPHWDAEARGLLVGLTRDTGPAHLARAALEAVAYQTRDLVDALAADCGARAQTIRIDGGMAANDWFAQFLADILGVTVDRPAVTETTALGAAMLAGVGGGLFDSLDDAVRAWTSDRRFVPAMAAGERDRLLAGWDGALARALTPPA
ncbi:glycerol kinase [Rhodothalassium salexigens]|uniref:glycerol kinase GlpK n=1 Tax=Rhodothalassium salexigens TaxID=1086 RepID=UPI001913E9A3|nr:glycerol kinase GlpK [Rhodothalassium salexigens]MBK5911867.1 glycerol kinase [Rhodothalassium salexigens]